MSDEFEEKQRLLSAQPEPLQRFLKIQAALVGEALIQGSQSVNFTLPPEVRTLDREKSYSSTLLIPKRYRRQRVGRLADRLAQRDLFPLIRQQLFDLEHSADPAVSAGATLLCHAAVLYLVNALPRGHAVKYIPAGGEAIPTIPVGEDGDRAPEEQKEIPCPPAALRFYLPQWVAFDDQGRLLVESVLEAEKRLNSIQRYVAVLQMAVHLAPYILTDEDYQEKRYGMLGQLVNQGRALARYQTRLIINRIWRRAAENTLNRGMSLSLPYFDDLALAQKNYYFVVIPKGRVLFVPAFVVCAVREVEEKVAQDPLLSSSTRSHLLAELRTLERAFESPGGSPGRGQRIKIIKPAPRQAGLNLLIDPSI